MKDILIINQQIQALALGTKSSEDVRDELSDFGIDAVISYASTDIYTIHRDGEDLVVISQTMDGKIQKAEAEKAAADLKSLDVKTVILPPGVDIATLLI